MAKVVQGLLAGVVAAGALGFLGWRIYLRQQDAEAPGAVGVAHEDLPGVTMKNGIMFNSGGVPLGGENGKGQVVDHQGNVLGADGKPVHRAAAAVLKPAAAQELKGHTREVMDLAFSPDEQLLASASADGTVKVWEVATGKLRWTLEGHEGAASGVSWSADGKRVEAPGMDGAVIVWDAGTGKAAGKIEGLDPFPVAAFFPDGGHVAVAKDQAVAIYEVSSGKQVQEAAVGAAVTGLGASPEGGHLAVGTNQASVLMLDSGLKVVASKQRQGGSKEARYRVMERMIFESPGVVVFNDGMGRRAWAWESNKVELVDGGENERFGVSGDLVMKAVTTMVFTSRAGGRGEAVWTLPAKCRVMAGTASGKWMAAAGGEYYQGVWLPQSGTSVYVFDAGAVGSVRAAVGAAEGAGKVLTLSAEAGSWE